MILVFQRSVNSKENSGRLNTSTVRKNGGIENKLQSRKYDILGNHNLYTFNASLPTVVL